MRIKQRLTSEKIKESGLVELCPTVRQLVKYERCKDQIAKAYFIQDFNYVLTVLCVGPKPVSVKFRQFETK